MLAALIAGLTPACKPAANHEGHDEHAGHGHDACESSHVKDGICQEHQVPEEACGICNPDKIAGLQAGQSLQLRLAAEDSAKIAGVTTLKAASRVTHGGVDAYAEIGYNREKLAQISAPVSGILQDLPVQLGANVTAQQVVARIGSAQIAETIAKAALSRQTLDRERKLRAQGVTSEKDLQEAEAAYRAVADSLRALGYSEDRIAAWRGNPQDMAMLDVRAPFAGEIVSSQALRGAWLEPGAPLFTVADREIMWADLALPESAMAGIRVGHEVELAIEALPGRKFRGKVSWIAAELDETTRLGRVRAEIPDPERQLRVRMFGRARVLTEKRGSAVWLPVAAIQRIDGKPFVFVKRGVDLFDARAVSLAEASGAEVIVSDGLKPGEDVAVDHSFALKSQLLISRLGAGCADD